jgi:hypothetical protein
MLILYRRLCDSDGKQGGMRHLPVSSLSGFGLRGVGSHTQEVMMKASLLMSLLNPLKTQDSK